MRGTLGNSSVILQFAELAVHPRACGELPSSAALISTRFIPAHAGNSAWSRNPVNGSSPRMRGTRNSIHPQSMPIAWGDGSSPRMRGTLRQSPVESPGSSPRMRGTPVQVTTVHPRACGELITASSRAACSAPKLDTPVHPRACGELTGIVWTPAHCERFIPAHAGNSNWRLHESWNGRFIPAHAGN